ncbi:unnamed protein product [Peniophora sp. CBMAI 1063]|nr:unnamed protein product [Peniophora sp. CBMAI 1063]
MSEGYEEPTDAATSVLKSASIDNLPPEILSQIFWHLPRLFDDIHTPVPPWAVVLRVCHKWREVSTAYADLWTLIPLRTTQWTELALRLSNPCPITIHFPDPVEHFHREPIYAAMNQCERSYSLDIRQRFVGGTMPDFDFQRAVLNAMRNRPPINAQSFSLSLASLIESEDITFLAPSQVRYLRLTKCLFSIDFIFPPNLVALRLEFTIFDGWTFDHLRNLLSSFPLLEELALISFTVNTDVYQLITSSAIEPVTLPHLKTLHLIAEIDWLVVYLTLIDIPPHTHPSLDVLCLDSRPYPAWFTTPRLSADQSYALLVPLLARHVRASALHEDLHIHFKTRAEEGSPIRLSVSTSESIKISCGLPPNPSALSDLLPDTARRASLICESTLPSLTLPAIMWRTSPYLDSMTLPSLRPLSSCSLIRDGNTDLPKLREIVFTEPLDMSRGGDESTFQELLLLLRNTFVTVHFEDWVKLDGDQKWTLECEYPSRVTGSPLVFTQP